VNSDTSIRNEKDIEPSPLSSSPLLIKKSNRLDESSKNPDSSIDSESELVSDSLGMNDKN
jgi:hypothetical protein